MLLTKKEARQKFITALANINPAAKQKMKI